MKEFEALSFETRKKLGEMAAILQRAGDCKAARAVAAVQNGLACLTKTDGEDEQNEKDAILHFTIAAEHLER